ncbi:unnamed protein product [Lactuca saligna]|uniref:Uncharacterized protein n=1 Tax=Lactuca saligna TaxID=75948 RepID=A0AA35UNQ2_LACSI|nr:unnamed protein product [Lactuca saligna]
MTEGSEASSSDPTAGCEGGKETGPPGAMRAAVATSLDFWWVCSTEEEAEGARGSISGKGGFRCGRREGKRRNGFGLGVYRRAIGRGTASLRRFAGKSMGVCSCVLDWNWFRMKGNMEVFGFDSFDSPEEEFR